jgi:hypothetical protein
MDAIRCQYKGGVLVPVGYYGPQAARELMNEGDTVLVQIDHPRSQSTHRHQWAELRDAWTHLPEAVQAMPWAATPETMRKHALIVCGFANTSAIDCGSAPAAQRVAPVLMAEATRGHGYAIVSLRGPVVTLATPESQSMRAMGGKRFQESKSAVLAWVAQQIGVTPEQLAGAA